MCCGLLLFVFADWDFVGLGCLGLFILVSGFRISEFSVL